MSSEKTITRKALGYVHTFGSYYDARRDNFLNSLCLKSSRPSNLIKPAVSVKGFDYKQSFSDTLMTKTEKLQINLGLTASLLACLIKPEGSGKFLLDSFESSQVVQASLTFYQTTFREDLLIELESLRPYITIDHPPIDATHVVTGIIYGHCVCASFEHRLEKNDDKKEIEAKLRIEMAKLPTISETSEAPAIPTNPTKVSAEIPDILGSASANIGASFNRASHTAVDSFNIKIFADFLVEDSLPQTVEEAMAFFKKLPQFLKNVDAKPVEYILHSIDDFKRLLGFTALDSLTIQDITEGTVLKIHHYAEQLLKLQYQIDQHYERYRRVQGCISIANRLKIEEKKLAFVSSRSTYRQKLADLLLQLRSNTLDEAEFLRNLTFNEVVSSYDECFMFKDKINLLNFALDRGCHLVDEHQTPDLLSSEHGRNQGHLYLLYISDHLISTKRDEWKVVREQFFELINRFESEARYFIIDYDLHSELACKASDFLLEHYRGTKLMNDQVLSNENPLNRLYCSTCGAEDNEERFVVLSERQRAWAFPLAAQNLQKMDVKLSEHGKVMTLDERKVSDLIGLHFQYYETLSAGNHLRYSTGKHHIEFEVVDLKNSIDFSLNASSMDDVTFDITFRATSTVRSWFTQTNKGDIYELIIDCNERKIGLINERKKSRESLNINTSKHPFPWKYRFCQDGYPLIHCFPIIIRIKQVRHIN